MFSRKWLSVFLSMIVFTVVTTACGGGGASMTDSKNKEGAVVSKDPVELTITSSSALAEDVFDRDIGVELKKKFPNYTVKYIKKGTGTLINDLITAGTPIDIIFETIGGMTGGVITPAMNTDISELVKKHSIDTSRFEPVLIDGMKDMAKGGLYGLPVSNLVLVTYYNKDLFDKFGVPYPKDGMTWDETIELGKKMTRAQDGTQYLGLVASTSHVIRMNPYSLPFVDPKTQKSSFGNEKWKGFLEKVFIGEASPDGYKQYMDVIKGKLPYKDEFMKTKNLAMFVYLSDLQNANVEMDNMNWDMVSAPTFKDTPQVGSQPYPTYWNVASISKHKDEAIEVIKYLTSDEYQAMLSKKGQMTVLKSDAVKKSLGQDYKKKANFGAVYFNKMAPISPKSLYDGAAEKPLTDLTVPLAQEKLDINSVLRQAEDTANKAIATEKSK